MNDLQRAILVLEVGNHTCAVCRGDETYTADARGVKPLLDWLDAGTDLRGGSAADKVVGRATAFLYVLLGVTKVHARVMSTPAKNALISGGIEASCDQEVPGIINRRGDGPCPFEDAVLGITDPVDALAAIRRKQFFMRQPAGIQALTAGKAFRLDQTGLSGSAIGLYESMVLKCEPVGRESDTNLRMLRWLEGKIPVPKVLACQEQAGFRWLLLSRLPGSMSCDEAWRADPERLVTVLAKAMKSLWLTDISDCPVDEGMDEKLRRAGETVASGLVNMDLVEPETFGQNGFASPAALLEWLQENRPEPDPVLSHGDFCLPNIFLDQWKLSGFLDLGRCGISDRWMDIAICWRSLRDNFGGHYGDPVPGFDPDILFHKLGIEKDEKRLRYYLLVDELF